MARPEDELGYDSACEDEHEGGVLLAEYEGSMMELDTVYQALDYSNEALEQGFFPKEYNGLEDAASSELADDPSEGNLDTSEGLPSNVEAVAAMGDIVDQPPSHEAMTVDWSPLESELLAYSNGDYSPAAMTEPTHIGHSSYALNNDQIAQAGAFPSILGLDDDMDSAAHDGTSIATVASSEDFLTAGAESHQMYPQMPGWAVNLQNQFSNNLFSSYDELRNMSFVEFLRFWSDAFKVQQIQSPQHISFYRLAFPPLKDSDVSSWMSFRCSKDKNPTKVTKVTISDVDNERWDPQGINWGQFGPSPEDTRKVRKTTYFNHANMITDYPGARVFKNWSMFCSAPYMNEQGRDRASIIPGEEKYFSFSRMDLEQAISIPHFQLRHIVSASSKNAIFYPTIVDEETGSHITCVNPDVEVDDEIIDSANCGRHSDSPKLQKISTLTAKNGVLIAGGLNGEYAMKSLTSTPGSPFTSGMVTLISYQSSTNHVHTYLDRRSGLPQAVFSSNDNHTHTLDCSTNKFISHHNHVKAINCAATSPDTRLRLLVRDAKHPLIVEADTGRRIGQLSGHDDFGFACDWSDDGIHMATGAQDGLVQIYDMRSWHKPLQTLTPNLIRGKSRSWRKPIQTLASELGGVRTLAFSPLGSGPPVLVMAESADYVHVVDGVGFDKKQTIGFFGEVAGLGFEPEGERFWVGIADPDIGGLMEFERNRGGKFKGRGNRWGSRWDEEVEGTRGGGWL